MQGSVASGTHFIC